MGQLDRDRAFRGRRRYIRDIPMVGIPVWRRRSSAILHATDARHILRFSNDVLLLGRSADALLLHAHLLSGCERRLGIHERPAYLPFGSEPGLCYNVYWNTE